MGNKTEQVKKLREIAFANLKQWETVSYAFHSYTHNEQDNEVTTEDVICFMDVVETMVVSVGNSVRAWMDEEDANG